MTTPPQAITAADLVRRWRDEAARWGQMAADARDQPRPDRAMAERREYRAEVYESCADDLEAAAPHLAAADREALNVAIGALRRLSFNDEMAGMGQRDDDPEAIARCQYASRALERIAGLLRQEGGTDG